MSVVVQALAVLLLVLQAAGASPATQAAAAPVVAATAPAPADDPAADLVQLRQMYRDTCSAREFGAYDDMCDQLHKQVRLAERRAEEAARRRPARDPAMPRP